MLEWANAYPEVAKALPAVKRERDKLPRQYIANVIHTIVGEPFEAWVSQKVTARNEKRAKEEGMIELDPEIA